MQGKISKNIFISLGIIALWTLFVFVIFYKNNTGLGKMFGVSLIFFMTRNFALGFGLLVLLLSIFKILNSRSSFVYIFSVTLNLSIALLAIALFIFRQINMLLLHYYLLSLIVGFLLIANIWLRSPVFGKAHSDF